MQVLCYVTNNLSLSNNCHKYPPIIPTGNGLTDKHHFQGSVKCFPPVFEMHKGPTLPSTSDHIYSSAYYFLHPRPLLHLSICSSWMSFSFWGCSIDLVGSWIPESHPLPKSSLPFSLYFITLLCNEDGTWKIILFCNCTFGDKASYLNSGMNSQTSFANLLGFF